MSATHPLRSRKASHPIREGITGRARPLGWTPRGAATPRGGLLDVLLVALLVFAVGARTPLGGLGWFAAEWARGHEAELPTLTAYFTSGASWTPPEEDFPMVLPSDDDGWVPLGGVGEPERSAVVAVLSHTSLPPATRRQLAERGLPEAPESALRVLDETWGGDLETALVSLAIGPDLLERAVRRARAAGDPDPERYASHRRYLSEGAARDADRLVNSTLAMAKVLDLHWPLLAEHRVTSPWGDRDHPVLHERRFHNGVDLSVPEGTPVYAAQSGRVAVVGEDAASGRFVVLDHGHGVRTSYCHLSSVALVRGVDVARGEVVAASGNTGRSTGPHLHFVVRIAGSTVDPERFRRAPES